MLLEQQFGQDHWHLSRIKRVFYRAKPFIPHSVRIHLRRFYRSSQNKNSALDWPIEDRFVRFQKRLLQNLMEKKALAEVPYIHFWPEDKDFAFVLTHDVETTEGFEAIPKVVELEKKYGFRSIFNMVPEKYQIDISYLDELRKDGFEIGIHGLKHDGKLFLSKEYFSDRAKEINQYAKKWGAKGFRSPLMHRNPHWMNELEFDYDMSFFDTDPYEPIPGGAMSIWPYFLLRFVELPYTLAQDFTLFVVRREKDIKTWTRKIDFLVREKGMVLLNVHPDYIDFENKWSESKYPFQIYEKLLSYVTNKGNYWHALPKDVAKWWRARAQSTLKKVNGEWNMEPTLEGGHVGIVQQKT